MAHKTMIGGTSYNVTGGKCLVSGTEYNISGGKTLVNGTGYNISFAPVIPNAYAMYYSDGNMVFQRGDTSDNSRILEASYTGFENTGFSSATSVPWYKKMMKFHRLVYLIGLIIVEIWFQI